MDEKEVKEAINEAKEWTRWVDGTIKRMAKILYANELISIEALAELVDVSVEEAMAMVKPKSPKESRPDRLVD